MKWLPVCCYLGVAVWQVTAHYREIWPTDPAQREALRLCFLANPQFDRLDPATRAACLQSRQPQTAMRALAHLN
jgi:hypothetical protein